MFANRRDAGRRLAAVLGRYAGRSTTVLALPRGGVPVAAEIARALASPLDVVLVRKVGVPGNPEFAMGAVVDGGDPIVIRNEDLSLALEVPTEVFEAACRAQLREIERRRRVYVGSRPRAPIAGRVVIVVDDGIATGATMKAALAAVRRRGPQKLVLAVPVAAPDSAVELRDFADEVVCLETPRHFTAVGNHYGDFGQVSDEEVVAALREGAAESERVARTTIA